MKYPHNVAGLAVIVSQAVTYVTVHWGHVHLPDFWAQMVTGGIVYAVLLVRNEGLRGIWQKILNGARTVMNGTGKSVPPAASNASSAE